MIWRPVFALSRYSEKGSKVPESVKLAYALKRRLRE